MFSKMDSIDGSSDFKLDYTLHCNPEDMEKLLKGERDPNLEYSESSSSSSLTSDESSCSVSNGSRNSHTNS